MDNRFYDEVLIKAEIENISEPIVYFENLIPAKCGIIFICSNSTFYINCIVENCTLNKNFYEVNSFIEHIGTNHQHLIFSEISNKTEPFESAEAIQKANAENDKLLKKIDENDAIGNVKILLDKNPLQEDIQKTSEDNLTDLTCKICGKLFLKSSYLKRHLKRICNVEKVRCLQCNRTFKNDSYLRFHMVVHKKDKPTPVKNIDALIESATIIKQELNETANICEVAGENSMENSTDNYSNNANEENFIKLDLESILPSQDKSTPGKNTKLTRTCHICNKTFQSRKYLRRHIKLHNNIKPIKIIPCPKCNKLFKYDHHLRFHMVVHDVEHKCTDCDKVFKDQTGLQRHVVSHLGEKPFKCEECNSKFSINRDLQRHIRNIHEKRIYECCECRQNFINKKQLQSHKLEEHGIYMTSNLNENLDLVREPKIYKCIMCNKIFKTNRLLKRHIGTHNKKSEEPIPCPRCNKSFKYEHHLKMHVVTHDKIHKCSECGKIYANRRALVNHIACHGSEKHLKCELCETWCFTKIQLKRHISDVHCEKKYECEHCGKKFRKKHTLIGHIRTHTKEKPFICEICGMGFFTPFLLNNHIKRHNNQRDFKCTFEGCDKTFFNRGALVDHEVTHTKLKPFFCTVEGCHSRFTLRSGLVKHKKLHSNIKNYICKICGKAYAQSPGLYAHMKTHGQPLPTA